MKIFYSLLIVILFSLSIVYGTNSLDLKLDKSVYGPFAELKGMCVLKLDRPLDLGLEPKIKLSISERREERDALDVLKGLDPDLDVQESSVNLGIIRARPKNPIIITAKYLKISGSKGIILTIYEIDSVKRPKLNIIPKVIPSGFLCPPVVVEDNIIGKRGQMHGAKIVTSPDMNAKINKININLILHFYNLF